MNTCIMLQKILKFDIDRWLKEKLAPFKVPIAIVVVLLSIFTSILLFVKPLQEFLGFMTWGDNVLMYLAILWALMIAATIVVLFKILRVSLYKFVVSVFMINLTALVMLIIISIALPGKQTCGINSECPYFVGRSIINLSLIQAVSGGVWWRMWSYRRSLLGRYTKTQ